MLNFFNSLINITQNKSIIFIVIVLFFIVICSFLFSYINYKQINHNSIKDLNINIEANLNTIDHFSIDQKNNFLLIIFNNILNIISYFVYIFCFILSIFLYYSNNIKLSSVLQYPIYWLGSWEETGIALNITNEIYLLISYLSFIFFITIKLLQKTSPNVNKLINILMLSVFLGVILMICTYDLFNFYVACEVSSVAIYAISTFSTSKTKFTLLSSLNYLIYGSLASCFILLGIGLIFFAKESFTFSSLASVTILADNITTSSSKLDILHITGIIILYIGLMMKLNIPPFNFIANNAYRGLNNIIAAFLSSSIFIPFWYLIYNLKIIQNLSISTNTIYDNNIIYNILILTASIGLCNIIQYSKNFNKILKQNKLNESQEMHKNYKEMHENDEKIHKNDEKMHKNDEKMHENDEKMHKNDEKMHENIALNDQNKHLKLKRIIRFFKKIIISYVAYSNIILTLSIFINKENFVLILIYEGCIKFLIFFIFYLLQKAVNIKTALINKCDFYTNVTFSEIDIKFLVGCIIVFILHIFQFPLISGGFLKLNILLNLLENQLYFAFFSLIISSVIIIFALFDILKELFFEASYSLSKMSYNLSQINNTNDKNIIKHENMLLHNSMHLVKFITMLDKIIIIILFSLILCIQFYYN